jgi:putative peptidoglycan lipid II flippase
LDKFKNTFLTSFHQMMYFVIPFSVILLILRVPVVRIVYGVSNFPWEATVKTAYILAFFSLSIFAQSSNYLTTRAFFALKDTVTPVKVSFFTILLNVTISLGLVLYFGLGVWAVALAFTTTSILDMLLLFYFLHKKVGGFDIKKVIVPFTKISYAAVMMGITLYIPLKILDQIVLDTTKTINLLLLTGIASVSGMTTYLFFTWIFKVEEIQLIYKLAKKIRLRKPEKVSLLDTNTKN